MRKEIKKISSKELSFNSVRINVIIIKLSIFNLQIHTYSYLQPIGSQCLKNIYLSLSLIEKQKYRGRLSFEIP